MMNRADTLLPIADDELILGWRDSEWTGIAPDLEEDVAFSSIAQNEIGHARALYTLAAAELGTTADELAFDRDPAEYRCAAFVELRVVPDWAATIARHYLYEVADEIRLEALKTSDDGEVAGLAAKIDREEVYHRLHAEMWIDRLTESKVGRLRLDEAVKTLWPQALGVLPHSQRQEYADRVSAKLGFELPHVEAVERGGHSDEFQELWDEMTEVRRSVPGATW
jgi:ring-1,2-phenylacetyl-CoA epoxidase subunit PaaC